MQMILSLLIQLVCVSSASLPTILPTATWPTVRPTSLLPTLTLLPTSRPTLLPTILPTSTWPTVRPTSLLPTLTLLPTSRPTLLPTLTLLPTILPTSILPTSLPTSTWPTTLPTSDPTVYPTPLPSPLPSSIPSSIPSSLPSSWPSSIPSSLPTSYPTATPTAFPTNYPTFHPTEYPTAIPSSISTRTPSAFKSVRPSRLPSSVPSYSPTAYPTELPSFKPTPLPSNKPTLSPSSVPSKLPTNLPTTATPTGVPSSKTPSIRPTAKPSSLPSPLPTTATEFPTISIQPTSLSSCSPSFTPTIELSALPTIFPSSFPTTSYPSVHPSATITQYPTQSPSNIPTTMPSDIPTANPTFLASSSPCNQPTYSPTPKPSSQPSSSSPTTGLPSTSSPSSQPTTQPVFSPSSQPSLLPTQPSTITSSQPTTKLSWNPSSQPTCLPTHQPSTRPSIYTSIPSFSSNPSETPTACPTQNPSAFPTNYPTFHPTEYPGNPTSLPQTNLTELPTSSSTDQPTSFPTVSPSSRRPSQLPSRHPTSIPTTRLPTVLSSELPTLIPSAEPTPYPTLLPSTDPTAIPSKVPSALPTFIPTAKPSDFPTVQPSRGPSTANPSPKPGDPSSQPTTKLSDFPSNNPSSIPSESPSSTPSTEPTLYPTAVPSSDPSEASTVLPTVLSSAHPSRIPSSIASSSTPTTANPSPRPTSPPNESPMPSMNPTKLPTDWEPTDYPTCQPTAALTTSLPSNQPSILPSRLSSGLPTKPPTFKPTYKLSIYPSSNPSPTFEPTEEPSNLPTYSPTFEPTDDKTNYPTLSTSSKFPTFEPTSFPSPKPSPFNNFVNCPLYNISSNAVNTQVCSIYACANDEVIIDPCQDCHGSFNIQVYNVYESVVYINSFISCEKCASFSILTIEDCQQYYIRILDCSISYCQSKPSLFVSPFMYPIQTQPLVPTTSVVNYDLPAYSGYYNNTMKSVEVKSYVTSTTTMYLCPNDYITISNCNGSNCYGNQLLQLLTVSDTTLLTTSTYCSTSLPNSHQSYSTCAYLYYEYAYGICQNVVLLQGCVGGSCSGVMTVTGSIKTSLSPTVNPTNIPTVNSVLPSFQCPRYTASNTSSAQYNYTICTIPSICTGYIVIINDCNCIGDTYIRLFDNLNKEIASNDNGCVDTSNSLCSSIEYIYTGSKCIELQLHQGCYDRLSCSGQMSVNIDYSPTAHPVTSLPTSLLSSRPSRMPTPIPTTLPTLLPSACTSTSPTDLPTVLPGDPTPSPTYIPTSMPTNFVSLIATQTINNCGIVKYNQNVTAYNQTILHSIASAIGYPVTTSDIDLTIIPTIYMLNLVYTIQLTSLTYTNQDISEVLTESIQKGYFSNNITYYAKRYSVLCLQGATVSNFQIAPTTALTTQITDLVNNALLQFAEYIPGVIMFLCSEGIIYISYKYRKILSITPVELLTNHQIDLTLKSLSIGFYFHALSNLVKTLNNSYDALGLMLLILSKCISVGFWLYILYVVFNFHSIEDEDNIPLIEQLHKPAMGYGDKKTNKCEDVVDDYLNSIDEQDEMNISTDAGFPLYTTWIFLSSLDITLLRYLPWIYDCTSSNSDDKWRSILKGYPSLTLAKTCTLGFLSMQSVQTLSSAVILIGKGKQAEFAGYVFLAVNMVLLFMSLLSIFIVEKFAHANKVRLKRKNDIEGDDYSAWQHVSKLWRRKVEAFLNKSLKEMHEYIPPNIASIKSIDQLKTQTGYSDELCERIFQTKSLWLIRLSKSDIGRLSYVDIKGVYNPLTQDLDIVELAAIYKALHSVSFLNDLNNKKALFKNEIEKSLMVLYSQYKIKLQSNIPTRHPAYNLQQSSETDITDANIVFADSLISVCTDNVHDDLPTKANNVTMNKIHYNSNLTRQVSTNVQNEYEFDANDELSYDSIYESNEFSLM